MHDGGDDLVSLALDGAAEQVVTTVRLKVRVVGRAILGRRQRVWPVAQDRAATGSGAEGSGVRQRPSSRRKRTEWQDPSRGSSWAWRAVHAAPRAVHTAESL